jgi:hypothetical protein
MKMQRLGLIVMVLGLAVALAACGGTKTVIIRETATPAATAASATNNTGGSKQTSTPKSIVSDEGTGDARASGKITVPDEVGKNHQAAQDDMEAHGLFNLSEEDATGQGRMMIWDRNWKVVSQSPAPGTRVNEDATITLRAEKYSD